MDVADQVARCAMPCSEANARPEVTLCPPLSHIVAVGGRAGQSTIQHVRARFEPWAVVAAAAAAYQHSTWLCCVRNTELLGTEQQQIQCSAVPYVPRNPPPHDDGYACTHVQYSLSRQGMMDNNTCAPTCTPLPSAMLARVAPWGWDHATAPADRRTWSDH